MNWTLIGIIILFLAYAVNRYLITEAVKKLDDSVKLKIFNAFSESKNYTIFIIVAIVLLEFGALHYFPQKIILITVTFFAIFAAFLIFRYFLAFKKLNQIDVPSAYMKSYVFSTVILAFGFLSLFICLMAEFVN